MVGMYIRMDECHSEMVKLFHFVHQSTLYNLYNYFISISFNHFPLADASEPTTFETFTIKEEITLSSAANLLYVVKVLMS